MRGAVAAVGAGILLLPGGGPYDMDLVSTSAAPQATGAARLIPPDSPFGVGVTEDGHAVYLVRITTAHLPPPGALGGYRAYVAWATTPDLSQWVRLGTISEGISTVGPVELNKFLLVISSEPDSTVSTHSGRIVLHGTSPSGWLQSFLTHPLFRGVVQ